MGAASRFEDSVKGRASDFEDSVKDVGRSIEDEVRNVGSKIDDEIIEPVKETVEAVISDPKQLLALGISIAFPGAGAFLGAQLGLTGVAAKVVGQAMLNTAINGGDVKSAVLTAAIPVVGSAAASSISSTLAQSGVEGALNRTITNSLVQGGTAAALGQDPTAAFLFGGVSSAVPAVTSSIPGFNDLPDFAKSAINSGVSAELTGGDGGQAAMDRAMSFATREAGKYFRDLGLPQPSAMEDGYFLPGGAGYYDKDAENAKLSGPGYYDEITGRYIQDPLGGLQGPLDSTSGTRDPGLPWEYNQVSKDVWEDDKGNQIDLSYIPSSQQAQTGAEIMRRAGALPKTPVGGPVAGGPTQNAPGMPAEPAIDFNQLMSLLGTQQEAPTVVTSGQDNSADVQLMENIFGTSLSAPPAGDPNEQARELARLLRS